MPAGSQRTFTCWQDDVSVEAEDVGGDAFLGSSASACCSRRWPWPRAHSSRRWTEGEAALPLQWMELRGRVGPAQQTQWTAHTAMLLPTSCARSNLSSRHGCAPNPSRAHLHLSAMLGRPDVSQHQGGLWAAGQRAGRTAGCLAGWRCVCRASGEGVQLVSAGPPGGGSLHPKVTPSQHPCSLGAHAGRGWTCKETSLRRPWHQLKGTRDPVSCRAGPVSIHSRGWSRERDSDR